MKLDKETKQEIKRLKKEKQFEEIYSRYGSKVYVKSSPRFYMRKLILELIKEGKYEEIKQKFGKGKYNAYLPLIRKNQVLKKTKNRFLANLAYVKGKIIRSLFFLTGGTIIAVPIITGLITYDYYQERQAIIEEKKEIIEEYNEDLEEYASYIRSLNLTQKEIVVKVISDIYEKYKYKYKSPTGDINGLYRFYLYENGYGVCRNIADDFCAKLNAIDSSFNAHIIYCKLNKVDEDGEDIHYDIMDNIERIIEDEDEEDTITVESRFLNPDTSGNHVVAVINIKGEPVPLVVDPTNPAMGAMFNGEIYMFNTIENADEVIDKKILGTLVITENPLCIITDFFDSLEFRELFNDLKERYGTDALEETLEKVREKVGQNISVRLDKGNQEFRLRLAKLAEGPVTQDSTRIERRNEVVERDENEI